MIEFVWWHLRKLPTPLIIIDSDPKHPTYDEWREKFGPEIISAERGDIEPLRRKLPHLAKFLHIPPSPVGKRKTPGYTVPWRAERAAGLLPEVSRQAPYK